MPRTPLPTRQRRPGWVALAVTLILGFAALGAYLYTQAGAKTPVVVVVADVPAGQAIQRSDLSTVAVAGGVTAIAARNLDSVVGQTAAVHLLPNMLLQRSMLGAGGEVAAGQAQVGVVVKSGQVPAEGVAPGDTVQVLGLGTNTGPAGAGRVVEAQVLVPTALVTASRADPSQTGATLLTIVVPLGKVPVVAQASGSGQVAVAKVAPT